MLGDPPVHRPAGIAGRMDHRPFLESYRALPVRKREFERLTQATMRGVNGLHATIGDPDRKPVMQISPERCVMQLGPVALTLAWLRSTLDSAAEGQLLVIVWRGLVATVGPYRPDRTTTSCTPVRSATAVWEQVFRATAEDEPSWLWRPATADIGGYRSVELAERCVERLRLAHADDARMVAASLSTRSARAAGVSGS